ncbi:MAG: zinc-dependent alcohol dehydrogenase family protein [Bdellovibrionales bacterium]|nr:zinc-dependent alcohol dehydrogenase family protein [Bdellovibrionales bacterium]
MKAQVLKNFGGPEAFELQEKERPILGPLEVLVRVKATSINPVDYKIRSGILAGIAPALPMILHGDMAGVVEAVGSKVSRFNTGDEVYGCIGGVKGTPGALNEYVAVDPDLIALKPKTLSMRESAALPLVSITAWEGLVDRARVERDQTVLVYGGTGGVGHIAVQLAKAFGAKVFATASSEEKLKLALSLGADHVINYQAKSVSDFVQQFTEGKGFQIVFDSVGGNNIQNAIQATRLSGQVVVTQKHDRVDITPMYMKGLTLHTVLMLIPLLYNQGRAHHGFILEQIAKLVDAGKLKPLVDPTRFDLKDVSAAHAYAESGKNLGKVVINLP